MKRSIVIAALAVVAAVLLWHPAPGRSVAISAGSAPPAAGRHPFRPREQASPRTALVVYVVGAVRRPGLYPLASSARLQEAVRAAGGLRPDADPVAVNLAARAEDGEEVVVPVRGAPPPLPVKKARTPSRRAKGTATIVALNQADARALMGVPGIGPALATRIVEVRVRDGAYTSFDQLLDVAGMTQSRLDRIEPYLRL